MLTTEDHLVFTAMHIIMLTLLRIIVLLLVLWYVLILVWPESCRRFSLRQSASKINIGITLYCLPIIVDCSHMHDVKFTRLMHPLL